MLEQKVQFSKTADGVTIAYATTGHGPPCLWVPGLITDLESGFRDPWSQRLIQYYASDFTVIRYDKRGMGLSSRESLDYSLPARTMELEAVIGALGLTRFVLRASSDGTPTAIAYSASHPHAVEKLILFTPFPSGSRLMSSRGDALQALASLMEIDADAGTSALMTLIHGGALTPELMSRLATSPETIMALAESYRDIDVTDLLPKIRCPTLVVHGRQDKLVPLEIGREVASAIPGARFFAYEGNQLPTYGGMDDVAAVVRDFLGVPLGLPAASSLPSSSASSFRTVLFTDLVGHTEMMSRLGDERGRAVLREHERITREVLKANGGTEVKTMGDGFMASFGSVTRAVECAIALQRAFADREGEPLNVRVGLNAGEPIEEDGDLFGATVILASRIAAKADGGEILVADTVRGLCSGKGFLFSDRGEFVAKGIEEPVRISEVDWRHA